MILLVGLLGLLAFVVASAIVGLRILFLALRTKQLPEMAISLSLLLAGGVGTGLTVLAVLITGLDPRLVQWLNEIAIVVNHIGYGLLFAFVWRVFRPSEAWGALLFGVSMAALVVGGVGMMLELVPGQPLPGRGAPATSWFWLSLSSRFVVYGWAAIESFRYHAMMKRRLAIGLADQEVVDRFFYWGVSTVAVCLIWINLGSRALFAESLAVQAMASIGTSILGFVVAGSLFRAFFPMGRRISAGDPLASEERS
ncbi:MAG TPA: hypothetical protein ENI85_13185 [Deltaproteobacteria bacterium]|nr:hypothetical protein [Deltaproteobacteria bacterium]